jgi:ATP-dependent DNA helicase DinG
MEIAELLGLDGPLVRHVPGFAPRCQQQVMAGAVAKVLEEKGILVAEAGTGTGKTYAYLVPALLLGGKVIISTGTRNLQDQLFFKDLPIVRHAFGVTVQLAMLKGRSNYLCRYRLDLAESSGRWLSNEQLADLARIRSWAGQTRHGDIAELSDVAENSPVWSRVTSTVDNCLGQECPFFQDCFVVKARRKAFEADILVINHHLFFAAMVVKEAGFAELLPAADTLILDEAHQLPEVAGHFFGLSLSSHQCSELGKDVLAAQEREAPEFFDLSGRVENLERGLAEMRLALGSQQRRGAWSSIADLRDVKAALNGLTAALDELGHALSETARRGKGLENCYKRCEELALRLEILTQGQEENGIYWFETRARGFSLNYTPLEIAPLFREYIESYRSAWLFTSATLTVGGDFGHFTERLGLNGVDTLQLDSPFDFSENTLLYHPLDLPEPASPSYTAALVEAALPVLQASQGRAFMLFTSYRALREAAEALQDRLGFPLLVQGSMPKGQLLVRFRELGNAVLLGTASFWEGVDVRGEALSCVIIDKLPFASPDNPVLQGRLEAMRRRGDDPFLDYQLPQAVIALKQGVGRLIRDARDRGVLMLGDPRLFSKPYGKVFLDSLPPMPLTHRLAWVRRFFADRAQSPHDSSKGIPPQPS